MASGSLLGRRAKVPDVAGRVERLEQALVAGGDRLEPEAAEKARAVLARTDERLRLGADHTVVALAGSTGSGKSSLFNALTGTDIARVGVRRPTTSAPTASTWGGGGDPLLDWLEVPRRHAVSTGGSADLDGLVLLDLPDHDSTELAHRLQVDRMVDLVDLLVWVVDPQKYADEALHSQYLRRLSGHGDVMLLVLNQVDRVPTSAVHPLVEDLRRLLSADGLPGVRVLPTSVSTKQGLPELRAVLGQAVREHRVAAQRAAADLDAATDALRGSVVPSEADPDKLGGTRVLVDALAGAAGVPAVVSAVQADYRRQARARTGWPFTRWARRFRPDPLKRLRLGTSDEETVRLQRSSLPEPTQSQRAQVELATRRVAESAASGLPTRWTEAVRTAAMPPGADVADALDQAVTSVNLERRRPAWWGLLGFLQVLLAAAAVVGLLWLGALFVLGWLRLPEPETPMLGPVPWPTVLLLGGLALGLLLAVVAGRFASWGARRRGRRTEKRLRAAVEEVADKRVLEPVAAVLRDHRVTRQALGVGR